MVHYCFYMIIGGRTLSKTEIIWRVSIADCATLLVCCKGNVMLILLSNLIRQHFRPFNKTSYLAGVQKSSWLVFGPASNSSLNGLSKEYVLMFHPEEQSVSVKKFTGQHKKFMTQWSEAMTLGWGSNNDKVKMHWIFKNVLFWSWVFGKKTKIIGIIRKSAPFNTVNFMAPWVRGSGVQAGA